MAKKKRGAGSGSKGKGRKTRRKTASRGPGQPGKLTTADLEAELRRRQRDVDALVRKRDRLKGKLDEVEAEIASIQGQSGRRPRNEQPLADALTACLDGQVLSVTEAAEEVRRAGYQTSSPNFRTIVNQTLIKDDRFKRVGRGLYTVK